MSRLQSLCVVAMVAALLGCQATTTTGSAPPPAVGPAWAPSRADPIAVLRDWDRRRAAAYALGEPSALRSLYLPGSGAGRRDERVLRAYASRGLRVVGLVTQLLEARVHRRSRRHVVLVVTDRITGATAVGRGVRIALPRGAARTRVVSLAERRGRWVVTRVRARPGG